MQADWISVGLWMEMLLRVEMREGERPRERKVGLRVVGGVGVEVGVGLRRDGLIRERVGLRGLVGLVG